MEKPILSTNINGFLIDHSAFIEPHKDWFDKAIEITKNKSLEKWKGNEQYFKGVDIAMKQMMPNATLEQRTLQARQWYQEAVIEYIKKHPKVINLEIKKFLQSLKTKYTLALITSNTSEYIHQILKAANLTHVYDIIFASSAKEKPDTKKLFEEFSKKYRKPKYHIASRNKNTFEQCLKFGINCIYFASKQINPEIQTIAHKTVSSLEELKKVI